MTLPNEIPAILLPGCNLFPQALLPLFIFEPRYRAMLRHALAHDRLFCIGTLTGPPGSEDDADIDPHSTAGLVRACVGNPDGTSHLVLQGVQRIRITGWVSREPFRVAAIEPLETCDSAPDDTREVADTVLTLTLGLLERQAANPGQLAERVRSLRDPALLADFVASHFIDDADSRQPLLRMADVNERLHYLHRLLTAEEDTI